MQGLASDAARASALVHAAARARLARACLARAWVTRAWVTRRGCAVGSAGAARAAAGRHRLVPCLVACDRVYYMMRLADERFSPTLSFPPTRPNGGPACR